ncbi:MAG: hypothetical protein QG640_194 [Patescibacteria group bacterium]|nr:hypothetical protein [Patescibacteria group bacterium]
MKQFAKYARYYDSIYKDKDYKKEADFVEQLLKSQAKGKIKNILSIGCGTCMHELILEKSGYKITGIDRSEKMVALGKEKLKEAGSKIKLLQGDTSMKSLGTKFDAVVSLFNVIGYQTTVEALDTYLAFSNKHLKKGGLLAFDAWYQPAIVLSRPQNKEISAKDAEGNEFFRKTTSVLDIKKSVLHIRFEIQTENNGTRTTHADESHYMTFFTMKELEIAAQKNGFKLIKSCQPFEIKKDVSEDNWNMWVVMQKI